MRIRLALCFTCLLWILPAARALRFGKWAWGYVAETGSINSYNDWNYAKSVGLAYLIGIAAMLLLCWLLSRGQTMVLWTLWALACLCVGRLIWVAPEEPIVLFPFWSPMQFSLTLAGMGMVGVASYFDHRKEPRVETSTAVVT